MQETPHLDIAKLRAAIEYPKNGNRASPRVVLIGYILTSLDLTHAKAREQKWPVEMRLTHV
jgi:hypothetical protein